MLGLEISPSSLVLPASLPVAQLSLVGVVAFFWVLKSSTSFLVTCLGLLFGHVYHVKSPAMQKFCVTDRPPLAYRGKKRRQRDKQAPLPGSSSFEDGEHMASHTAWGNPRFGKWADLPHPKPPGSRKKASGNP